jgi:hypothetical protein
MANQSSARLKGDDYLHLLSWYHIIELLKKNSSVSKVRVEDPDAGHVDDVTVFYKDGKPVDYYQIKYHVDLRSNYTLDLLLDNSKGTSLLEKFYKTYKALAIHPDLPVKLSLITNWGIDPKDAILSTRSNEDEKLSEAIYTATPRSGIGKLLKRIKKALRATDDEVKGFLKVLCFCVGKECSESFRKIVSERMELVGLKHDENALAVAAQVVRDWIKKSEPEVDISILQAKLREKHLLFPADGPVAASVYLTTVKSHRFDVPPDCNIDLRHYYAGQGTVKGHELLTGFEYNADLLPQIAKNCNHSRRTMGDPTI